MDEHGHGVERVHRATKAPSATYEFTGMSLKQAGITLQPGESYVLTNPEPNVYFESGYRLTERELTIVREMQAEHGGFSR